MIKPEECESGRCLFLWMVVMDEIFWDTFSDYRFPLGTIKRRGYQKKNARKQNNIFRRVSVNSNTEKT